ncbi:MAG: sensor histidine kinase, partial [Nannocystaceae bacterium]
MHVGAIRRLRRGRLAVLPPRNPLEYPRVIIPLMSEQTERLSAIIVVEPKRPRAILLGIGLLCGLAVVTAGAWLLSRSLTQRVIKLEGAARRLAGGDLSARAGPLREKRTGRSDELDSLAATFDDMAERIDHLVRSQKSLLTNVSHELRTPLARMRVLSELMTERPAADGDERRRENLKQLEEDIAEMERLVRDLLTSGRLDLGGAGALESAPCDLRALSKRCVAQVDGRCDLGDAPMDVRGDALLLERLLSNLLGNARRAAGTGGEVRLQAHRGGDALLMMVLDDGDGIPEEHRESVFDPFVRLDEARARDAGGTGLGLFLCRQIVEAHGGSIRATNRPDGARGACIEIKLPRTETSSSHQAGVV